MSRAQTSVSVNDKIVHNIFLVWFPSTSHQPFPESLLGGVLWKFHPRYFLHPGVDIWSLALRVMGWTLGGCTEIHHPERTLVIIYHCLAKVLWTGKTKNCLLSVRFPYVSCETTHVVNWTLFLITALFLCTSIHLSVSICLSVHLYLSLIYPFARQAVRWGPFINLLPQSLISDPYPSNMLPLIQTFNFCLTMHFKDDKGDKRYGVLG